MQRYATSRSAPMGHSGLCPQQFTATIRQMSASAAAFALAMAISIIANPIKAAEADGLDAHNGAQSRATQTRLPLKGTAQPAQPGKLLSVTMAPLDIGRLKASAYGDDLQLKTK